MISKLRSRRRGSPQQPAVDLHILEFQADAVELEKQPLPASVRGLYTLLCALFITAVVWSILGKVDMIVSAKGRLITTGKQILIQPLVNSIIKEFHVEVGHVVSAGQPLVSLDPTFAQANETELKVRISTVSVLVERLESELSGKPFVVTPSMPATEADLQLNLYLGRREEYSARLGSYDSKLLQNQGEIDSYRRKLDSLYKQLAAHHELLNMRKKVFEEGADSRLSLLEAESRFAATQADAESVNNNLKLRQLQVSQITSEREAFISNWRNTIASTLAESRKERDSLIEQHTKASRYHELSQLVSPVDAVVLDLGRFSVGAVAKEGEAIMTLVPLNLPLEAEVSIETKDVGYVRLDDPARLKLDAFPFQRHGTLDGKLRVVSEDAYIASSEAKVPTYQARVGLLNTTLRDVSRDTRLLPGMTLTAEIVVGQRRVISYLAYPLIKGLDESMREP
jgi:HlyD family secretion protein